MPRPQLGGFLHLRGQVKSFEIRDVVRDHPHHDGDAASLCEYVHAESRELWQAVRNVAGAFLSQLVQRVRILGNQVIANSLCVVRAQHADSRDLQLRKLSADFDLRRAAGRKNQVAYFRRRSRSIAPIMVGVGTVCATAAGAGAADGG